MKNALPAALALLLATPVFAAPVDQRAVDFVKICIVAGENCDGPSELFDCARKAVAQLPGRASDSRYQEIYFRCGGVSD